MNVVTRFAPSPTGFLHIGGARTALFNWLFARRHGGAYLLRIEDTDRERSTNEAIEAIIEGLDWLGLAPDGAPVFQSERATRHAEIAMAMVERGAAFRCYCAPEEVEALRGAAHAEGRALRSPYRDGAPAPHSDAPFVVRLRAPDSGDVVNPDLVQGEVRIKAQDIDDLVLLRADGAPTYMLAVVVDDHDMGVTHVIRGDDHLTNAARQIPIFTAMGWNPPQFAHIPLIHGPDGAKLSKRHGALAVQAYRDMGYLPEALCNYLMRLGWSHGDAEIMSREDAASVFDIAKIGKAPSRLDFAKLDSVNAHYLKIADDDRLLVLLWRHIESKNGAAPSARARMRVAAAIGALKERAKTIPELARQVEFLIAERPLALDDKSRDLLTQEARERLSRLAGVLSHASSWTHADLGASLKTFAAEEGIGLGKIGPSLRAALTGGAPAPDLGQTLEFLGRDESLARIKEQV